MNKDDCISVAFWSEQVEMHREALSDLQDKAMATRKQLADAQRQLGSHVAVLEDKLARLKVTHLPRPAETKVAEARPESSTVRGIDLSNQPQ